MKNDQQRPANSEADQHTLPNPAVASHQFLIVPSHQSDCIGALSESKYGFLANRKTSSLRTETGGVTLSIVQQ